jgi:TRAP-type C4-dicarboxylate transport system permease small subunit
MQMQQFLFTIRKFIQYIVYAIIVLMILIICWQVLSRFFLGQAPSWSQELSLLLMVWGGFFSIALGFQDNTHIRVTLLTNKLPLSAQKVTQFINRILSLLFGLFMIVQGGGFAIDMRTSLIPGLKLPSIVLYSAVPVAGLLIAIYVIAEILGKWNSNFEETGAEE